MGLAVRFEDELVIPGDVVDLASFRRWAASEDFPEKGRIDFLNGTIEIDMSPEEPQTHGVLKVELLAFIHAIVKAEDLGQLFADCTRLVCPGTGLSCEPDILLVGWDDLTSGRARWIPSPAGRDRYLEVEGAVSLVVEVISDSSVGKDTRRLPPLYAGAGVRELWLADARSKQKLTFRIMHLQGKRFRPAGVDEDGFQASRVLHRRIRVRREPWHLGTWRYFIDESPI